MAEQESERVNTPISRSELERRWTAVRKALAENRVDVLVMQQNNDFMGGYVKYFTDLPATYGYPTTVVFPKDDSMVLISHGPFGLDRELPPESNAEYRGVARIMGAPSFASAPYTAIYDAQLAEKALAPFSRGTIGLVGSASMPHSLADHLKRQFSAATFVEASDLVDRIKAPKSEEEIALIRRTAAMQDAAMEAAFAAVEPGKRDIDIAAVAEHTVLRLGGEQGLFLTASGPVGAPPIVGNRHTQQRRLRKGDQFTLLIETNGAGGFYTEIARTCVLGKASQEMKDELAFALEARKSTLKMLKPGASCKDIWDGYNRFMRDNGRPEEQRVYCHGQGYDLVERPLVRFDEPMPIQGGIVLAVHPCYQTAETLTWICDDYLVARGGAVEWLHKFPEKIVELG